MSVESVCYPATCDRDGCNSDALWTATRNENAGPDQTRVLWRITCPACDVEDNDGEAAVEQPNFTPLPLVAASWQWLRRGRVA